mgnify:CR=1 FL=1
MPLRRLGLLAAASALALSSVWAIAQDAPESLLPPGFDRPKANPAPRPAANPAGSAGSVSVPVVQQVPGSGSAGSSSAALPVGFKLPSLKELEAMSPDELDELLGLKPKFDMPAAARRSMKQIGVLGLDEGGFAPASLARQNPARVKAALDVNQGPVVSRGGHILLRRALASRLDAPQGMNPADFAAARAALLLRMGEGEAARAIVQDIDAGNYSPALTQAAVDAFAFTADITGVCPVVMVHGGARKDADWRVLRGICAAFQGDGAAGMAQLDRLQGEGAWPKVDILLAQKYAGAAGKARRAVKIEWDGVNDLNPWRYALTIAVGLEPPASLMKNAPARYTYAAATAPMLPLATRAAAADRAGGRGILSAAAMIDLYAQIYAQDDITGDWAANAATLRNAYVAETPDARMAAMRQLWDGASEPQARYSRQVLTAYAAARMPVEGGFASDAPDLVASMLAAGLDANALRWAPQADTGSLAWGQLALAAPQRPTPVDGGALDGFYGNDDSPDYRKSGFLLAGLMGLNRVEPNAAREFAAKLDLDMDRQSRWSTLIEQAADANNQTLVALLAGLGMQGTGWDKMTPMHLYHIVAALNRVGLTAEARMIAAEAVARG